MTRTERRPILREPELPPARTALMIASGDSRRSANVLCWPTQQETERQAGAAFARLGWTLRRASPERFSDAEPHGFIFSQAHGREVFSNIHPDAPLVVVESVWQYSQHVLAGLVRHRGPILILANWSGQWPGLVGALNLRGSLTKAGVEHALLWGEDFADSVFMDRLEQWCQTGSIAHDVSHVRPLIVQSLPRRERELGQSLALALAQRPAIMGVFDEGCMGMFNAIIPDHLLHPCGVYKERLSQSTLYAAMGEVDESEAQGVYEWLCERGMRFNFGTDEASELTERQVIEQCRMYIAALRLADRYGCDVIGIQYQLGLTATCAASDLVEGMLNCSERPPVRAVEGAHAGKVIHEGRPLPHFNEVDECAGLDALITDRVWSAMGLQPDNTLHDVRWGDRDRSGTTDAFVWVFEISGAVPASHFARGWQDAIGERQPAMYFARGGSTIKGVSKPGEVVWSRVYVDGLHGGPGGRLCMDIGRLGAIELPESETKRRWESTTPSWPIMHAVTYGITRDQFMAKHQSNHIQVVYAPDAETADRALAAKAAMARAMGIEVHLCGSNAEGLPLGEALRRLG
ncbi:MAG: L-fucose/L-arabinose isomerase family protein [Phycisphaerales bacterium]